jgi:hypothetical protein
MSVSRAVSALVRNGEKAKALELLDLVSKEIPAEKYNDPRSLSSIVTDILLQVRNRKVFSWLRILKKFL